MPLTHLSHLCDIAGERTIMGLAWCHQIALQRMQSLFPRQNQNIRLRHTLPYSSILKH